jgi:hypothetical protein
MTDLANITFGELVGRAYAAGKISNLTIRDANLRDEHTAAEIVLSRLAAEAAAKVDGLKSRAELAANPALGDDIMTTLGWLKALSPDHAAIVTAAMQRFMERAA